MTNLAHALSMRMAALPVLIILGSLSLGCAADIARQPHAFNTDIGPADNTHPTLEDFWLGRAKFEIDQIDTGLPMGESDTIVLANDRLRSYVHASGPSLGTVDSCGAPVPFPGCVVVFESDDGGFGFEPVSDENGGVSCLLPCASCPCESQRDHIDQQQYPRVARTLGLGNLEDALWIMVYEYRASVFIRTSADGLAWSVPRQLPWTGIWQTWMMPCRSEESIGTHPHAPQTYDCLVGGPPGVFVDESDLGGTVFFFVGSGQNPGSMGCYLGPIGAEPSVTRKCDGNPLFVGSANYGDTSAPNSEHNSHFDFRTISSAEVIRVGTRFYMLYEGVRGPAAGAPGDTQFALGIARSISDIVDGPWETFPGNPILVDVPGNVGVGHADLVIMDGRTILFTSLDGTVRSRLSLRWK